MDPSIKARFNPEILAQALERFAIDSSSVKLLDGFESFIYEFERGGKEFILRLGHSQRRSEALIQAEVDWINYLAAGISASAPFGVARAVFSGQKRLVEPVPDGHGQYFLATAFIKANGHNPRGEDWTPTLYQTYGALLGRMHALAKSFPPPAPGSARYAWDDPQNIFTDKQLLPGEPEAAERYLELMAHLRSLPTDPEGYGMIHQDAHGGNFFFDPTSGAITLFDFDDCCYGHFIYDLAMVIFYYAALGDKDPVFIETFLTNFFRGYQQENRLDPTWLCELPTFMKLREVDLYGAILHAFTPEEIQADGWVSRYMTGRRESILARTALIDYQWEKLAVYLV